MPYNIIKTHDLSFAYNGREVLHGVTLNIEEGEYVSVIGPNGAGKSTLLKCLNRIVLAEDGSVEIGQRPLAMYSQKELGQSIGYVPQIREHSFTFSVYEFVMMGRYPYLKAFEPERVEDRRIVREVLELAGLSEIEDRRINTLSGGERQKVYLAASLAQQPRILLLDEPTTHLDPKHQVEIQRIICNLSRRYRMTVLHVTHDFNHIMTWSHKVIALKGGKVFGCGTPQDILTSANMDRIFDVPFLFFKNPKTGQTVIVPEEGSKRDEE